ncbi:PSD1 and planctomycete cytochrome C domain-containing protein [Planctomicrobium sp. SH661]|uniref:PSD1 and planctomycete cytochrome C domain-containing protein n=1 Tax=Planctomicrobium sp. SH661 TaxID=3448124 RepID=UPI003F5C9151
MTFVRFLLLVCMFTGLGLGNGVIANDSPSADQLQFFEKQVRPLLAEHCYKCHSGKTAKGDLRVDSRGQLLLGGESGPAIEPGKPGESLLMQAIRYESFEMPPSGKLKDEQIAILSRWIEMGAPWPGDDGQVAKRVKEGEFTPEDRNWWAFQPVSDPLPPLPQQPEWCRNPIDQFIAASRERQRLTPAPEAEKATLIRRLYYDLIGLPPTPDEIRAFESDTDPSAYEKLVDDLLARAEYGERWAQHWLDLVRFAESDGYRADIFRPEAWRYRDYVIRSLNQDKPYDRFVQEQLAGDELFPNDPDALIATGFLRHGMFEYNVPDVRVQCDNILNEVTDVTGDVFLGLGFQCARCHDHKFDPILQKDYFRLRAFFEPILPHDDIPAATSEQQLQYRAQLEVYQEKTKSVRDRLDSALAKAMERTFLSTTKRYPDDIQEIIRKPSEERTPQEKQFMQFVMRLVKYEQDRVDSHLTAEEKEQVLALRRELAEFDSLKPAPLPRAMTIRDVGPIAPPTIIPKRNLEVLPGFPTILDPEPANVTPPAGLSETTGRRSALSLWLTDPRNPLSTRVIVNRVWQYHFGRGLAPNSSDFGRLGDPPSHPELLDWLTSRFLEGRWKLKGLHRMIVTSATYRQRADHPLLADYQQLDPTNRWYWRGDVRRLSAEQIRDSLLAVTGQLKKSSGGPSQANDRPVRSIYTRVLRNSREPLLEAFDLPFFMSSNSNRDTTTSPIQSLLLINSQSMLGHAGHLARRASSADSPTSNEPYEKIERLWWLMFGRRPSLEEMKLAQEFLKDQESQRVNQLSETTTSVTVPTGKVPYREGQAVLFQDQQGYEQLMVPSNERLNLQDFTVEIHFQLRSIYQSGEVRTLAAKTSPQQPNSGWLIGITGKASRRKPQTLVLQLFGKEGDGKVKEVVLFSDHDLELNKPYFAAASIHLATRESPGTVTFFLKDLSNDDEPLTSVTVPLTLTSLAQNDVPLTFGSQSLRTWRFDGLIDDIRLSNEALEKDELLIASEGTTPSTIGYWRFEPNPGLLQNSLPEGIALQTGSPHDQATPADAAFVDLCHVLLNSSEFLYVD